ncbi:MAG: hypothetical protein WD250_11385 [Egibacteraceae bacterium]
MQAAVDVGWRWPGVDTDAEKQRSQQPGTTRAVDTSRLIEEVREDFSP